jgi:hypothetical protein
MAVRTSKIREGDTKRDIEVRLGKVNLNIVKKT